MELLPNKIREAFPPLRSKDGIPLNDQMAVCKFYTPTATWNWYAFEAEQDVLEHPDGTTRDDVLFFGMVHGHERELGYFRLSELESLRNTTTPVIRDQTVFNVPYRELGRLNQCVQNPIVGTPDRSLPLVAYHNNDISKVVMMARSWLETWIAIGKRNNWIGFITGFNQSFFSHCASIAELKSHCQQRYFVHGQAFTLGNLCFMKQWPMDEWLVIKENIAFDLVGLEGIARTDSFANFIVDLQNYSIQRCVDIGHTIKRM